MKTNSIHQIKDLNEKLSLCFQDTNLEKVDLVLLSKEMSLLLNHVVCVEDVFKSLIELLKQQQDLNLKDSRSIVNEAIKEFAGDKDPRSFAKLNFGEYSWELCHGQVMMINSNQDLSSEIYQHLIFNLLIPKHLKCVSFMEEAKKNYIFSNLLNTLSAHDEDLNYNSALVQLKNNDNFIDHSYFHDSLHFENHVKYLKDKHNPQVIYIDDILSVNLEGSEDSSRQLHLQRVGELLLHLGNRYELCFIIRNQYAPKELNKISFEFGNILNFTAHALHFQSYEADSTSEVPFFELYNLKSFPMRAVDVFFDTKTHLISSFTAKSHS
ncbi:hypothetical protein [Psychroflexus lacisalsi]|jgi:hypothetical protein|uniref:FtsK domain-containing protein n=1 Tax=Psychroflexus lacisalsi TaxID=503928 RepID=A0ABN1KD29_9FLAO|nr:hypothetical protein [Psychroflexus lacisalsi]MBZ9620145.1 hypothetical protein [Psychroflexus lacisalsi]